MSYFYHSDQPWGELSNFSRHSVFLHGLIWPTAEHCYQGQKFVDMRYSEMIRRCQSPAKAKLVATESDALSSQRGLASLQRGSYASSAASKVYAAP